MNNEEDPDIEIYGTSPGVIAFFMILISLLVPIGIIPFDAWMVLSGGINDLHLLIYSLIWVYTPDLYVPFTIIPVFLMINI